MSSSVLCPNIYMLILDLISLALHLKFSHQKVLYFKAAYVNLSTTLPKLFSNGKELLAQTSDQKYWLWNL